jgi:hypothetical protein
MRFVIVHSLHQAKQLEADPRVADVCMLYETFTLWQKVGAFLCWRLPLIRYVTRLILRRWFFNPYSTLVFALREPSDATVLSRA